MKYYDVVTGSVIPYQQVQECNQALNEAAKKLQESHEYYKQHKWTDKKEADRNDRKEAEKPSKQKRQDKQAEKTRQENRKDKTRKQRSQANRNMKPRNQRSQERTYKEAERPRKQNDTQARNMTMNPEEERVIGTS